MTQVDFQVIHFHLSVPKYFLHFHLSHPFSGSDHPIRISPFPVTYPFSSPMDSSLNPTRILHSPSSSPVTSISYRNIPHYPSFVPEIPFRIRISLDPETDRIFSPASFQHFSERNRSGTSPVTAAGLR